MAYISRSDDPIKDFERYDTEQARQLEKLPRCADCDEPIQDEHFYLINDECICPDCLESNYRKDTEAFID